MATVFRSKIDTWLLVVLLLGALAALAGAVTVLVVAPPAFASLVAILLIVVGAGLPLWLLASTYYRIDGDALFISSGPVRVRVPLRDITSITPTNNPLSSPALSLDRLRIEYGRGKAVMVSPRDKQDFIRCLEAARGSAV